MTTPLTLAYLLTIPARRLDQLFHEGTAEPVPSGDSQGTLIVSPGTRFTTVAATIVRTVLWQGKVFYPGQGMLYNKVTPLSILAEKAQVYRAASWFDGREAIIVDYAKTGIVARWIRDELRLIASGLYLGHAYRRSTRQRWLYFALELSTNPVTIDTTR